MLGVVEKFWLWDHELQYVTELITRDPRNNSAWNQRFNAIKALRKLEEPIWLAEEVEFVLQTIHELANNESPWNYLRGLTQLVSFPDDLASTTLAQAKAYETCHFALAFVLYWHER
jgi:protein farnesyltransferase/geranylgeranyltransferase type-1 subunit alpha